MMCLFFMMRKGLATSFWPERVVQRSTVARLCCGWIMMSFSFKTSKAFAPDQNELHIVLLKSFLFHLNPWRRGCMKAISYRFESCFSIFSWKKSASIEYSYQLNIRVDTSQLFSLFSTSSISSAWNFYWAELLKTKDTKTILGWM